MTCTSPCSPTITFDGVRSRWRTPREWAKAIACATRRKIEAVEAGRARSGALGEHRGQGPALDQPHGEIGPTVVEVPSS